MKSSWTDYVCQLSREFLAYADTAESRDGKDVHSREERRAKSPYSTDNDQLATIPKRYRIKLFNTAAGGLVRFRKIQIFPEHMKNGVLRVLLYKMIGKVNGIATVQVWVKFMHRAAMPLGLERT